MSTRGLLVPLSPSGPARVLNHRSRRAGCSSFHSNQAYGRSLDYASLTPAPSFRSTHGILETLRRSALHQCIAEYASVLVQRDQVTLGLALLEAMKRHGRGTLRLFGARNAAPLGNGRTTCIWIIANISPSGFARLI